MPLHDFEKEALENCDDLETYNHTELYQLCRAVGRKVSPADDRATLAGVLDGRYIGESRNPIDSLRDGLMDFLLRHWKRVHAQLFCPAKSGDPQACYSCCDAQVIHCFTVNPRIEPEVTERIKEMEQANVSMKFDINNAPRNLDELKAIGPLRLRYLALAIGACPTAPERSAFCAMNLEDQAKQILEFLKRHDATNTKPEAVPQPAAVTAQEAPAAPTPPKRTPRVGRPPAVTAPVVTDAAVATEGTTTAPATPALPQLKVDGAVRKPEEGSLATIDAAVTTIEKLLQAKFDSFARKLEEASTDAQTAQKLATMQKDLEACLVYTRLNTAICLLIAQATLGDSRPEILSVAVTDLADIAAMLGKVLGR